MRMIETDLFSVGIDGTTASFARESRAVEAVGPEGVNAARTLATSAKLVRPRAREEIALGKEQIEIIVQHVGTKLTCQLIVLDIKIAQLGEGPKDLGVQRARQSIPGNQNAVDISQQSKFGRNVASQIILVQVNLCNVRGVLATASKVGALEEFATTSNSVPAIANGGISEPIGIRHLLQYGW
jgi:hypothetical protein